MDHITGSCQLRNVLNVAAGADLRRFVFTSTYATVGRRRGHLATEADVIDRRRLNPYVESRVQAEEMVLRYVAHTGLPAVAMCISTTYGGGDWGATPHGAIIAKAVRGELPAMIDDVQQEVVGIDDAAKALILAAERGNNGERYIISERMIPLNEVVLVAADEAGVPPPRWSIPVSALYVFCTLRSLREQLTGRDDEYNLASLRLLQAEAHLDNRKAIRELHWQPRPIHESIREAARYWIASSTPTRSPR